LEACGTTTTKTKVAKLRVKRQAIGTADLKLNVSITLRCQWHLSDKLSVLFEPCHERCIHGEYHFNIGLLKMIKELSFIPTHLPKLILCTSIG